MKTHKRTINIFCPSCNSNELIWIGKIPSANCFAGKILDQPLPGGNLYRCSSCHFYFRWPRLQKEQLDILYQEGNINNWQYEYKNRKDWQIAAQWLNTKLRQGRVLDTGCFDGRFLTYLGNNWNRYGIEICEIAARNAEKQGIHIIAKDFTEIDQLSIQFDAVVAFDIVEHVEDPRYFLKQLARVTRPDGTIIIATGNSGAPSWKFMSSRYWYCTIAEHISFINEKWCYVAAYALNLDIEHIERFSHIGRNRTFLRIILDLTKNILYKLFPDAFGRLRLIGFGGIDVKKHKELKQHPPNWASAKDHLIIIFKKP